MQVRRTLVAHQDGDRPLVAHVLDERFHDARPPDVVFSAVISEAFGFGRVGIKAHHRDVLLDGLVDGGRHRVRLRARNGDAVYPETGQRLDGFGLLGAAVQEQTGGGQDSGGSEEVSAGDVHGEGETGGTEIK